MWRTNKSSQYVHFIMSLFGFYWYSWNQMVSTKNFSLVSMICISLHLHEESFSIGMLGIEIGISLDVSKSWFQHKKLNFQMNWWKVRCNQVTRIFENWKTSSVRLVELFFHSLRACLSMYRTTVISKPCRHDNQISDTCWAFFYA